MDMLMLTDADDTLRSPQNVPALSLEGPLSLSALGSDSTRPDWVVEVEPNGESYELIYTISHQTSAKKGKQNQSTARKVLGAPANEESASPRS